MLRDMYSILIANGLQLRKIRIINGVFPEGLFSSTLTSVFIDNLLCTRYVLPLKSIFGSHVCGWRTATLEERKEEILT